MKAQRTSSVSWAWAARLVLIVALGSSAAAMARDEPSLEQVYQSAQAGQVERALQEMQPLLQAHPGSAQVAFVNAELLARQGRIGDAREALAVAERLSPGLAFADPLVVESLKLELSVPQMPRRTEPPAGRREPAARAVTQAGVPWAVLLAVSGGGLLAWAWMCLWRPSSPAVHRDEEEPSLFSMAAGDVVPPNAAPDPAFAASKPVSAEEASAPRTRTSRGAHDLSGAP